MAAYKIAVIGFGHIGRRHATIVREYPDTELVAIVDINNKVKEHQLYPTEVPYFSSIESFLSTDIDVDVVHICTPNKFHTEYALLALDKSHVLIEKPMGLKKTECQKVIDKAKEKNKEIFVVKQNRYSPPSKWLKQIVEDGILGDIFMVQNNCYWNRDDRYYKKGDWKGDQELDGGVLFTQFSHFVDIMHWVFGDITNINTLLKDFNHQELTDFSDSGISHFEFVNGGIGCIQFSTSVWDKNMESSLTVVGSKGSIKIGGQYMDKIEYCHIQDYVIPELPPTNPPNDYGPFKGSAANHHYVIENLVNTLNGDAEVHANAQDSMKVVDIIERIYGAAH